MSTTELMTYQDESAVSTIAMMSDDGMMNRMMKFAEVMATGKATIPAELRNVGDCLAITMQAMNWKMNPFSVAQKTFFISGKIGYEAQLVAAAINNSGAVLGAFHFEWYGPWDKVIGKFEIKKGDKGEYRVPGWALKDEEGIGIKCWATLKGETEPRVLDLLLAQARTRNSTLWADDPRQQLAYLAQKRWARLYAPGVILGVYTADELEQIPQEKEINPLPKRQTGTQAAEAARTTSVVDSQERTELIASLEETARDIGIEAYADKWKNLKAEQRKMVGAEEHDRLKKLAMTPSAELNAGAVADEDGVISHD
jgi:hypothetical protein